MIGRHPFSSLVWLHILHHASHGDVFGMGIMEELARHGYTLNAGTLYPLLHNMEQSGYLVSRYENVGGRRRRIYNATNSGKSMLQLGKERVRELYSKLMELG